MPRDVFPVKLHRLTIECEEVVPWSCDGQCLLLNEKAYGDSETVKSIFGNIRLATFKCNLNKY